MKKHFLSKSIVIYLIVMVSRVIRAKLKVFILRKSYSNIYKTRQFRKENTYGRRLCHIFLAILSLIKDKKSKWADNGILNFLMQFSAEIQSSVWFLCPEGVVQLGL